MKIGLISDTHGWLDPQILEHFEGVERILHAGDIGGWEILNSLYDIAPVTAVLGNTDFGLDCRETESVEIGDIHFFVHHIVNPHALEHSLAKSIQKREADVVIFGHTHKKFDETINGVRFINPGYSGRPRYGVSRSIALLELDSNGIHVEWIQM